MTNTTSHRFNIAAFAMATALTLGVNGSMLVGFNHLAAADEGSQPQASTFAKSDASTPSLTLERVVITSRRA